MEQSEEGESDMYILYICMYEAGRRRGNAALADRIGSRGLFDRVYNYTSPVRRGALSDPSPRDVLLRARARAAGRPLTPRVRARVPSLIMEGIINGRRCIQRKYCRNIDIIARRRDEFVFTRER